MTLTNYVLICDAIVLLMDPLIEIAIHNINKNKIVYIKGKLSTRQIGDPSLINFDDQNNLDQIVYSKKSFDGRLIKSISVKLDEDHLLCINCDISIFGKLKELSNVMLKIDHQPKSLFANDWQENLHIAIQEYLQKHHKLFENLTKNDKKMLTKHLFELGAFKEKNATDYVAKNLQFGRATIFKYLKEWRAK